MKVHRECTIKVWSSVIRTKGGKVPIYRFECVTHNHNQSFDSRSARDRAIKEHRKEYSTP